MTLLAHYWWILPIFIIVPLAALEWLHMPRSRIVLLLRVTGAALLLGTGTWLVTGNVETSTVSIHMTARQAALFAAIGLIAIVGAQMLVRRKTPAA